MIFDSISNKENYKEEKEIYQTLNFFEKLKKWDDVESNAIIQKDWISANPVSFLSKDESECMYEAHRKHIDVHYIMEGIEKIATADVKNLQEKVPFDKDKDIGFYEGCESGSYLLKTGDFMVCFPSDAHKVGILKGWGLIDGKLIAIDGTKIRAQNSKHNCITKSGLDKKIAYADEQINAYLMALEKDSQCEPEFKKKLEDYQELKKQYHQQKQALSNEGLEQKSLTDPDSRRMKNNGSLDICYNVQSAVDAQNHFVIDISTTNDINDQNQLYIMAKDASDLLETEECTVVADTGYYNASEIKNCLDDGMTVLIKKAKANNSTKDNEFRKDKFKYDPEKDVYICPAEQQLYFFENTSKNGMKYK